MRHPIDPKIDCVFKALLGAEANRRLLIHFLNAMLGAALPAPIRQVDILNPYNEREFLDDKLSIVDVKARDEQGRLYQVEIQLLSHPDLPARILYTWADLYSPQLRSGQDYGELRPTYAIWLLAEDLLRDDPAYAHRYQLCDERGRPLLDHGGIWLMELNKFAAERVETEQQRWLKFFTGGRTAGRSPPARLDADRRNEASHEHPESLFRERARLSRLSGAAELPARAAQHPALSGSIASADRNTASGGRTGARRQGRTGARRQGTGARRQGTGARRQGTGARRQGTGARRQGTGARRQGRGAARERCRLQEKDAALQEKDAALQEKDAALQEKDAALAELARLKALLEQVSRKE